MESGNSLTSQQLATFLKIMCIHNGKPKSLFDIVWWSDAAERESFSREELMAGLGDLIERGYIVAEGPKWRPTDAGHAASKAAEQGGELPTPVVKPVGVYISRTNFAAANAAHVLLVCGPMAVFALLLLGLLLWARGHLG